MVIEKGKEYMAGFNWKCIALSKASKGNVLVRWLTGPLAGREARILSKDMKKIGEDNV